MKNRKKIFIIMILFIGLSIASIAFAVSRTSGIFFAKGEKYSVEGKYGTTIYPTIRATQLIGTPVINVKCQKKVLFGFNSGANMDITITEANRTYYAAFEAESAGTFRITWEQTNDQASMIANVDVESY